MGPAAGAGQTEGICCQVQKLYVQATNETDNPGVTEKPSTVTADSPPAPLIAPVQPQAQQTDVTDEDEFYVEWAKESVKNNLVFANDVLQRLVTLNGVLLAGSIAFYDERIIPSRWKPYVLACFLLSLVVSFLGMLPYEGKVDPRVPADIKRHKQRALKFKRFLLLASAFLLAAGFGVCLGAIIHVF